MNSSFDSMSTPNPDAYEGPYYSGPERRIAIHPADGSPTADGSQQPNFGRRQSDTYLESMIASASPAKLRLMMIEKGVEVARHLATMWRDTPGKRGTNEHSLKLLELLSELLSGVTDKNVEVCRTVADLYVFLCQHLLSAEENGDPTMIDEIRLVLETEAETWRMVCVQESGGTANRKRATEVLSSGLNLQG